MQQHLQAELKAIEEAGLFKNERIIITPQRAEIMVQSGQKVLNFCANNYLGLSDHPRLIAAAKKALDERGYGMSSVRFICGTQDYHMELEKTISHFFIRMTLFSMPPASMPTEDSLNLFSRKKMPLSPMH